MPFLNVALTGSPDPVRSLAVAGRLTQLAGTILGKDPAHTAIAVHHVAPDHWFVDGRPLGEGSPRGFSLEIKITAGTNTKEDVRAFIDAVYSGMQELLGAVLTESYVSVVELPASHYGFGGQTQAQRFGASAGEDRFEPRGSPERSAPRATHDA